MSEEFSNHSDNRAFEDVLNTYMSRRKLIVGSLAGAALTFHGRLCCFGIGIKGCCNWRKGCGQSTKDRFHFHPAPKQRNANHRTGVPLQRAHPMA